VGLRALPKVSNSLLEALRGVKVSAGALFEYLVQVETLEHVTL
jgi:hypothetical protein